MDYTYEKIENQQNSFLVTFDDGETLVVGLNPATPEESIESEIDSLVILTLNSKAPTEYIQTYRELRAAEYPSIEDQLDLIFHGGLEEWKAEIQSIKDKYPKS